MTAYRDLIFAEDDADRCKAGACPYVGFEAVELHHPVSSDVDVVYLCAEHAREAGLANYGRPAMLFP
jgi:hypothetical protein